MLDLINYQKNDDIELTSLKFCELHYSNNQYE